MQNQINWYLDPLQQSTFCDSNLQYLEQSKIENSTESYLDKLKSIIFPYIDLSLELQPQPNKLGHEIIPELRKDVISLLQVQGQKSEQFSLSKNKIKVLRKKSKDFLLQQLNKWIVLIIEDEAFLHRNNKQRITRYFQGWYVQLFQQTKKENYESLRKRRSIAFYEVRPKRESFIEHNSREEPNQPNQEYLMAINSTQQFHTFLNQNSLKQTLLTRMYGYPLESAEFQVKALQISKIEQMQEELEDNELNAEQMEGEENESQTNRNK